MRYVSLLRGINVGGRHKIDMVSLRQLYKTLGYTHAKSYIQSGNVVFESDLQDVSQLERTLEQAIAKKYGFPVPVMVRTIDQIERLIGHCPFSDALQREGNKLLVAFLEATPPEERLLEMEKYLTTSEKWAATGREVYLYCPDGYSRSKLSNALIERVLHTRATVRNWNTVRRLYEMLKAPDTGAKNT